jgi:hypothetical protein
MARALVNREHGGDWMRVEESILARIHRLLRRQPQFHGGAQRTMARLDTEVAAIESATRLTLDPYFPRIARCEADTLTGRRGENPDSRRTCRVFGVQPLESLTLRAAPADFEVQLPREIEIGTFRNNIA